MMTNFKNANGAIWRQNFRTSRSNKKIQKKKIQKKILKSSQSQFTVASEAANSSNNNTSWQMKLSNCRSNRAATFGQLATRRMRNILPRQ